MAYYWALSILSGRQFGQVQREEHERLQACLAMADQDRPDEWLAALAVVKKFLNCYLQYQRGKVRNGDSDELIQDTMTASGRIAVRNSDATST